MMQINRNWISLIKLVLAFIILYSLDGCFGPIVPIVSTGVQTAIDPRGPTTVVTDKTLGTQISTGLMNEFPQASFTSVAYDHEILLAGQVPDRRTKESAVEYVTRTEGVRLVYNYITIGPNQSAATITNDTYLTSRAKTEIITQKGVSQLNTKVVTCDSVVYILGKNPGTKKNVEDAIQNIKQIDGVKSVVNLISSYETESKAAESAVK